MITIAFFNNKGGVGKTSLAYHLGWTYADLNQRVLLVDLDPQANLTGFCLDEREVERLWPEEDKDRRTVWGAVKPIDEGGIAEIDPLEITSRLFLIPGDLRLAGFEAKLNESWNKCRNRKPAPAFRAVTAFHQVIGRAGAEMEADLAILDLGPNLGELNHSALLAADWIVIPLAADLFSLQALRNVGRTFSEWRAVWEELRRQKSAPDFLPAGLFRTAGYVITQPHGYGSQLTQAFDYWKQKIPAEYAKRVLQEPGSAGCHELGTIRNYHSLMSLAQRARKPVFHLTAADGALGGHYHKGNDAGNDFRTLARTLAGRIGFDLDSRIGYSAAS